MQPDFSDIKINSAVKQTVEAKERKAMWNTPEGIPVKKQFSKDDIASAEHLSFSAGVPPFLRGPYSAMYAMRPWTIRHIVPCRGS